MSVAALNDPSKQIEIEDELESFFHALLWFAIRHLHHNCSDVGDFMVNYFDGGERAPWNPDRYACGRTKEDAITSGIIMLSSEKVELQFLLPPEARAPAASTSTPVPRAITASSASSVKASAAPRKVATGDRHPIHKLIKALLPWFSARYELRRLAEEAAAAQMAEERLPKFTPEYTDQFALDEYREEWEAMKGRSRKGISQIGDANRERLEDLAANLSDHEEMIRVMLAHLIDSENNVWPLDDKTEDQLPKNFNPEKTQTLKRTAPRDEDPVEESNGKRMRSLSS
ncbi:hypothetical protein C8Q78DRAFT_1041504 [Trametes maxima]|nr:hypothetical protein C8Q78DRAFT_1041504 [Trametes maxima]